MNKTKKPVLLTVYTRKPNSDYTESLSNSVHLAYIDDQNNVQPLNRNYGILFATADLDEKSVIQAKGIKNPFLFQTADGAFGIIAVRVDKDGEVDVASKGKVLLWTSKDLVTFENHGLIQLHVDAYVNEVYCEIDNGGAGYTIHWKDNEGQAYANRLPELKKPELISSPEKIASFVIERPEKPLEETIPGNVVTVAADLGNEVIASWTPLYNTGLHVPKSVKASSAEQVREVTASALYSDGSTAVKRVDWDLAAVDFSKPGTYTVEGKVVSADFPFPLTRGYADPVMLLWEGKYYYLATNDNTGDVGIFLRESDTIQGLFEPGYEEKIILDYNEEKNYIQTFWAPEFHQIGGELYILFAVGGKAWSPQCHSMKLRKGGNIMEAADWEEPVRTKRADGTYLAEDGITLDMTYFKAGDTSCVVWSYRKGIGTPLDTGSMIYIATINEDNPAQLTSEPVLLSRPLFGWENIQGTINNEGPYPLITKDTVYIAFSGGAATGYTYAVGFLTIPIGGDYLNRDAWTKTSTPVLSYYSSQGVYGPGHNSFFEDADGTVWILYHGEEQLVKHGNRCSAMHRVHFNAKGAPVLDVIKENDLHPNYATCSIEVIVEG